MSLGYSTIADGFPGVASVPPGEMRAPPARANNGWYTPGGGAGAGCPASPGQDAYALSRLLREGGTPETASRHMGGGGLRPGNNRPWGPYVECGPGTYCFPPGQERGASA